MGLLDRFNQSKNDYIFINDAIELLSNETGNTIQEVASFLINHDFAEMCSLSAITETGKIINIDDGYGSTFQKTFNIIYKIMKNGLFWEGELETSYCWLKDDFFGFLDKKGLDIPSIRAWESTPSLPPTKLERDIFLTALDTYDHVQAACLISGDNPSQMLKCSNDTNFDYHYQKYLGALDLIYAGINVGELEKDIISRQALQRFLLTKGFVIVNFNDKLSYVAEPPKILADQSANIAKLEQQLDQARAENDRLKAEIEQLKAQLIEPTKPAYTTEAIQALQTVINEFWQSYDPLDPTSAPKQDHIRAWIKENYPNVGDTMTLWIDRIARHPSAK